MLFRYNYTVQWFSKYRSTPLRSHYSQHTFHSFNQLKYCVMILMYPNVYCGQGSSVGIETELRAGRSGDRIPVVARFSAPVQTGPGAHPASCTMGTGSFLGVKCGRGVLLTTHHLPVPRSWNSKAIPLPTLSHIRARCFTSIMLLDLITCIFGEQKGSYYSVQKLLSSRLLSINLKIKIYRTIILPVVLYGYETWSLTLREERRLRVFENKVLRRIFGPRMDEVTGEWRRLHNEEINVLYSSPNIVRVIKWKRMRWAGHVARMGSV